MILYEYKKELHINIASVKRLLALEHPEYKVLFKRENKLYATFWILRSDNARLKSIKVLKRFVFCCYDNTECFKSKKECLNLYLEQQNLTCSYSKDEIFNHATFQDVLFNESLFENSSYRNCIFNKCDFFQCNFTNSKFINCTFDMCDLREVKQDEAEFINCNIILCKH
jgi:hypothetical protein